MISDAELILRLALAAVLCGLIGLERETRGQAAGLRTHILVGVGATLFTLVSAFGFEDVSRPGVVTRIDPTRIAAQIVTGIGFLGAGAIIRHGLTVRGLTTAASLWIVAALGMAVGAGYYLGSVATTALVLAALVVLRRLRPRVAAYLRTDLVILDIELEAEADPEHVFSVLARHGVNVEGLESEIEDVTRRMTLELRVPPGVELEPVLREIRERPEVRRAAAQGLRARRDLRAPGEGAPGEEE